MRPAAWPGPRSVVLGMSKLFRPDPDEALEFLDVLTERLVKRVRDTK